MSTADLTRDHVADPAPAPSRPERLRLRGPAWLAWRQTRLTARVYGGVLLVVGIALLYTHWRLSTLHDWANRMECSTVGGWQNPRCREDTPFGETLTSWFTGALQPAMFGVPLLVGMTLGAPLLAEEYERGTIRTVLAQSVAPARWLRARLLAPALLVLVSVGVLSALVSWVWNSDVRNGWSPYAGAFPGFSYASLGLAPLAWSLFALAVGAALGALLRRTVPAVLATGAVVALAELLVRNIRVHFVPLTTVTSPVGPGHAPGMRPERGAWLVESGLQFPDGTRISSTDCLRQYAECDGATSAWSRIHPLSHLLPMQLVETGLLLAASAVLVWFAFRRVTRSAV
ncbi:ABC transporter permease subunit [Kitasatospora sp. NPDC004531]